MAEHLRQKVQIPQIRILGIRLSETHRGTLITFSTFQPVWTKLSQRLSDFGFEVIPELVGKRVRLVTNATPNQIRGFLEGHTDKKSSSTRALLFAIPSLIILAGCVTMVSPTAETKAETRALPIERCTLTRLTKWLEANEKVAGIEITDELGLGGVISGTLTCDEARYSYTLELSEPKRVIKLLKLDS